MVAFAFASPRVSGRRCYKQRHIYTPQILDLLEKYHAKATFFVVGSRVKKYPRVAKELVLRGHEIANYTYHHPNIRKLSCQQFQAEIEQTKTAVLETTGITSHLFRPPAGITAYES
jgi:peptidoglycan/xylan/chitin deacetylase (PgdA/CDA1 family)